MRPRRTSAQQANQRANNVSQNRPEQGKDRENDTNTAWGYYRRRWRRPSRLMQRAEAAFLGLTFAALAGGAQIEARAEIGACRAVS